MNNTIEKQFTRTVLAASLAVIGFSAPLVAQAADADNIWNLAGTGKLIEMGVGYVSDGSYKFGDYGRGLQEPGSYLIGNVLMKSLGNDKVSYVELNGRNLGLPGAGDFGLKMGKQGNFKLSFKYGELSKLHSDSFMTPYSGMGTARLTAPAGWAGTIDSVAGGVIDPPGAATIVNTAMMTALAANMKKFNVETMRKAASFGLTKQLTGGWDVALNFKREEKDGTKLTGAAMQIGGGSRGVLLAPEPINYTTDLFDAVARYADEQLHMQVGYHVSLFKNSNRSLVFDNLFYNAAASAIGGDALTGQLGQMPDNQFHQVNASGGYNIGKETRLTGSLNFGRATQNEEFLPYTVAGANAGVLPATTSLNGKVDTSHADIKLNTKLARDLRLTAGYKYDDRNNKTPVNTYTYNTADNTNPVIGAGNTRTNTPLSKTQHALFADIDYALSQATRLKFGYNYDQITRTYLASDGDKEHTVKAEVKHSFSETATGGLAYSHSDRKAEPYDGAASLSNTYTAAYLASLCVAPNTFWYKGAVVTCTGTSSATSQATTPFLDTPALRKFFMTDRKRDKLRAFATMAPGEKLDLQFGASYYKESYPEAEIGYGLADATGWTANFDANLAATETISGVFFASFEDYSSDQNAHNGASETGVTTTLDRQLDTPLFFATRGGVITRTDRSLTAGLGFRFRPEDNYELGADFTHAATTGSTGFSSLGTSIAATIRPVPDTVSRLNRLELFGKYHMQKNVTLNLKYTHEKYDSTDWAWDGQTLTSSTSFIGSGQTSPDYIVDVIAVSMFYRF